MLLVAHGDKVERGAQLNEGSLYPAELLEIRGRTETELYLVAEVQRVYKAQGVDINDKHIELIVRQMLRKVRDRLQGLDRPAARASSRIASSCRSINKTVKADGGTPAKGEEVILGITKASLATESFLSAASFQETTKVLTDAALEGKRDRLVGLKENVIIGKLIPAATGPPALPDDRDRAGRAAAASRRAARRRGARRRARPRRRDRAAARAPTSRASAPSFADELEELASEIEAAEDGRRRPATAPASREADDAERRVGSRPGAFRILL